MNHEPNSQRTKRETCKTYRAIARVFEDRVDLTTAQKTELIHACYDAVQAEKAKVTSLHLESLQGLRRLAK